MRLPAFLIGLICLMTAIVVWGVLSGASLGRTVVMMLVSALVAQGFYLLLVVLLARDQRKITKFQSGDMPADRKRGDLSETSARVEKSEPQA